MTEKSSGDLNSYRHRTFLPLVLALGAILLSAGAVRADLPAVGMQSLNVQVANPKADRDAYLPGEKAEITTRVKNKSKMPIEAILLLDVILPDESTQRLVSKRYVIDGEKTEKIKLDYAIPADAPGGKYLARVFLRNPYVDKPFYSDDAVEVFKVNAKEAAPARKPAKEKKRGGAIDTEWDWPGAVAPPAQPSAILPFTPRKEAFASVDKPEFNWPRHPDAVSYKVYISKTPFSSANTILAEGVTDVKYVFDPADASVPLVDGRSYTWTVLPKDAEGNTLVGNLDGFFATFTVQKEATAAGAKAEASEQAYRRLLDNLVKVLTSNDRRALLAMIHPDWISTDTAFTDRSKFENSIIDIFNKVSTTFARWSTESVDVIVPGKRVTLSFTWTWRLSHTTYGARSVSGETVRLDIRNVDGKWLIREDLDRKIFTRDFGFTAPGTAPFTDIPPGFGTR